MVKLGWFAVFQLYDGLIYISTSLSHNKRKLNLNCTAFLTKIQLFFLFMACAMSAISCQ